MVDAQFRMCLPEPGRDGPVRQRFERGHAHELGRRSRHDHVDAGPGLHQLARKVGSFVRGNGAGHAQHHRLAVKWQT